MAILTKSELLGLGGRPAVKAFSMNESFNRTTSLTSIFLSHKHSDHQHIKALKSLLLVFQANIYIDWLDPDMPQTTRAETAIRIKTKIKENKKFILLATDEAIESKWCNW